MHFRWRDGYLRWKRKDGCRELGAGSDKPKGSLSKGPQFHDAGQERGQGRGCVPLSSLEALCLNSLYFLCPFSCHPLRTMYVEVNESQRIK